MTVPEGGDDDLLARFAARPPVVTMDGAWQVLDPMLNGICGWGASVEQVAGLIRRGPKGMEGLVEYVEHFVVAYRIAGGLLEGKCAILVKAMNFV